MDVATDGVKLLLVEDSPADVFLVREAMKVEGLPFRLQVADNGEDAIQVFNHVDEGTETPPDVLLVDLNVPRKDGMQVLGRMRSSPKCGSVPVIVISSSDSPADRQRAFALGASEYFRKPSSLDEFMKLGGVVRMLCRGARVRTA